ncbi:hypothetical protein A4G20_10380 [Pasteurellaceae bacterium RH1A]|nr:hypothetical protein A4G20_10380 [Pasteurellaceae bacterium RH1A]
MPVNKRQSIGYLSNHTARLFAHLIGDALAPLGVLPAYLPILFELWEGQALSQSDLVARSGLSQATMANTLNRMERDGLIERLANPSDARSRLIKLSKKAQALEGSIKEKAQQVNEEVLAVLSDEEVSQWIGIMQKVIQRQTDLMRKS